MGAVGPQHPPRGPLVPGSILDEGRFFSLVHFQHFNVRLSPTFNGLCLGKKAMPGRYQAMGLLTPTHHAKHSSYKVRHSNSLVVNIKPTTMQL